MSLLPRRRKPTRFEQWAWGPVVVLRISLVGTYLLYVYFAAISFVAGVPAFNLTTFPGYTSVWAFIMGTGAVVAAIGSISDRWEPVEMWGALAVTAMMLGYVGTLHAIGFGSGDINRQAVAAALTITLVLPGVRFGWLAAQAGKRKKKPRGGA